MIDTLPAPFKIYTFLNPREIPEGQRRMMMPDGRIVPKEVIPDWYWSVGARIVGHTDISMRDDVLLFSYFTCEEEIDGTLFHTSVSLHDDPGDWTVISRSCTGDEAWAKHCAIRAAWWTGSEHLRYPKREQTIADLPVGFTVPRHPSD